MRKKTKNKKAKNWMKNNAKKEKKEPKNETETKKPAKKVKFITKKKEKQKETGEKKGPKKEQKKRQKEIKTRRKPNLTRVSPSLGAPASAMPEARQLRSHVKRDIARRRGETTTLKSARLFKFFLPTLFLSFIL